MAKKEKTLSEDVILPILFDGNMRKMLVEGVLQDIKGFIEMKTDGQVEVAYDDYELKGHEFGFKMYAIKGKTCKKQMFSEATSAVINAISYAFQGNSEQYDVMTSCEDGRLEVEIVSNW